MARAHLGVSVVAMTRQNDEHNTTNVINNKTAIVNVNETSVELNATGEMIYRNESMDAKVVNKSEEVIDYNDTSVNLENDNETDTLWNVYKVSWSIQLVCYYYL